MPINLDDARRIADAFINSSYQFDGDTLEIIDQLTMEREYGWVLFYDSAAHIRTGDDRFLVAGNGPILVCKRSGEVVQFGTAHPVSYYLSQFARQADLASALGE